MAKKTGLPRPTDAELGILRVLWEGGPGTVREVYERLGGKGGYTTVLKFLQIMTEKGLVRRDETARTHVYAAAREAHATQRQMVKDLMERAFAGSAGKLVLRALEAKRATAGELAEVRAMLEEFSKQAKRAEKGDGK